ncbi:hypothetical protein IWQ60_011520 [Tieghemiomyces parasiticus]|uniref:ATPase inhibitor, mitochondrial n=1 Tax=Tieghemiomyces parasiticus TaxID=78921 RepID=A0A9W8DLG4_9FUNG|nr:hypothetical protein IWQ60_011520 [Tieghemiomyces parasiticus]
MSALIKSCSAALPRARFLSAGFIASQVQKANYTEGAIGKAGGSFKEKENALENKYIHDQEMAKIKKLQEQLAAAQDSVDSVKNELKEHVDKMSKQQK